MAKYLITGVSSGIGRALTKKLINNGNMVWGIARREKLLRSLKKEIDSKKFTYTMGDQAKNRIWQSLLKQFKRRKFNPDVVIFNAAISENDLKDGINISALEDIMEINFLGIMRGINILLPFVKPAVQMIAISSFSALKGSGVEGIGYAASKAALSVGFESLYQKYKDKNIIFKTIYFGPVYAGMGPFKKYPLFVLSEGQAVKFIISSVKSKKVLYYYPKSIFFIMKLIKLLPSGIYFKILSKMESFRLKL